jgi:hypothetical protein
MGLHVLVAAFGILVMGVLGIHETSAMKQSFIAHDRNTETIQSWIDCNIQ